MVVGRLHDLLPQVARAHGAVHPRAIFTLPRGGARFRDGRRFVHEIPCAVAFHRAHEIVGDRDADVEIRQVAVVLGVDELLDVGMVAAQDAHLGAAPRAGRLDRLATAVEHPHIRNRAAGGGMRAAHERALGPDRRKIVADAAAAPHRLGRFHQRHVDAGPPVHLLRHRVADRLHEAIDQRCLQIGAGGGIHAPSRNESACERFEKLLFPMRGVFLHRSQRARDAAAHFIRRTFIAFGVFLEQYVDADLLLWQR